MSIENWFDTVIQNVSSDYALVNYLKRQNLLVEPGEYVFPAKDGISDGNYHYVPILDVLQKLLSHGDIKVMFTSNRLIRATVYRGFADGSLYANDPFFSEHPEALQIQLYIDELELCNPIGAKRSKHKVTAVYYMVGNLHPRYR